QHRLYRLTAPPTPELHPLSLHDALPIYRQAADLDRLPRPDLAGLAQLHRAVHPHRAAGDQLLSCTAAVAGTRQLQQLVEGDVVADRKSTRLNSSHVKISYAVFCLKKKIQ